MRRIGRGGPLEEGLGVGVLRGRGKGGRAGGGQRGGMRGLGALTNYRRSKNHFNHIKKRTYPWSGPRIFPHPFPKRLDWLGL